MKERLRGTKERFKRTVWNVYGASVGVILLATAAGILGGKLRSETIETPIPPPPATPVPQDKLGLDPIQDQTLCDGSPHGEALTLYVQEGQVFRFAGHNMFVDDGVLREVPVTTNFDSDLTYTVRVGDYFYSIIDDRVPESHRNYELVKVDEIYTRPRSYMLRVNARCIGRYGDVPSLPSVREKVPGSRTIDLTPGQISVLPNIPLFDSLR